MAQHDSSENRVTTKAYWDSVWSPIKDENCVLHDSHFYYGRKGIFAKLIAMRLGGLAGKTVLELGGGGLNYRLLAMAKWMGARVTAVDFSEEGLRAVDRLFRVNGCAGTFHKEDVCEWRPAEQYDFVVHWGLLEHFVDPVPVLLKSAECLKPGGVLLFAMPNMSGFGARFWRKWCPESWSKHVLHRPESLTKHAENCGFRDVEHFYFGVPFFKITDWEQRVVAAQLPLDFMQRLASASARIVPSFHRIGNEWLSMEQGCQARKRA